MEPQYYKDRLGFNEPAARNGRDSLDRRRDRDSVDRRDQRDRNGQQRQTNGVSVAAHLQYETNVGYEENLSKFKGTAWPSPAHSCRHGEGGGPAPVHPSMARQWWGIGGGLSPGAGVV